MGYKCPDKTIGILVGGISDDFTKSICRGAIHQAKLHNIRTVTFPGKYINRDLSNQPELRYEYQFNTIFSCARADNLDAIICVIGSIGCFTDKDGILNMLSQYRDIPLVLVAMNLEGYICVTYDNYSGIEEGIDRMFANGRRHFGMISGNLSNTDVAERHKSFIRIMKKHSIPVTDSMFTTGNLTRNSQDAFARLLDQNPELDAVFCVNDDTALGFYEELKRRGLKPGTDVSVLGYDDTIAAAKADPTLSTVHADGNLLGEEALLTALDILAGKEVTSRTIPTQFVCRDSFLPSADNAPSARHLIDADQYFNDIFYRYSYEKTHPDMMALRSIFQQLLGELITAYTDGSETALSDKFSLLLEQFLQQKATDYADINKLLMSFEEIYQILNNLQPDAECSFRLRDTFSLIYRRLISSIDHQIGEMTDMEEQLNYSMKLFIRDMLQFEKGSDSSYASLLANLDWLQIKNAFLYLFETPFTHLFGEDFTPPEYVYLKAVLQNGTSHSVPSIYQQVPLSNVFRILSDQKVNTSSFVLFPLFYNETLYGLLLCNLTEELYSNGEFLVNQMSSATRMIHLLRANEEIQKQLEESLSVLKENNIALDTLSRLDSLTGILNRRGFEQACGDFLAARQADGMDTLVLYIDMNNLKIINDRYGHEEGDFSIRLIADILLRTMEGNGIPARIGGDEFACIFQSANTSSDELIARIYQEFDAFNAGSDKPYNITVSAGAYTLAPNASISLKQALTMADESLYEVKKLRRKEVAKVE